MRRNVANRARVILDSNVIVSGTVMLHGVARDVVLGWRRRKYLLVISSAQRSELADVLRRPKFVTRYGVKPPDVARLLRQIDRDALLVTPQTGLPLSLRDVDDMVILSTAVAAEADYLVSGDKDILAVAGDSRLGHLQIVTPIRFLEYLEQKDHINADQ